MNNLKTIVHITQYFHPLKGYQENQFARIHEKYFNKTYIICSSYLKIWGTGISDDCKKWDNEFEKQTGVHVIRLKTFPYGFSGRVFIAGLKKVLDEIQPDVVYAHSLSSPMTIITSNWLKKNRKSKKILTIVDDHMVFIATENRFSTIFYKLLRFLYYKRFRDVFDKWIAVSDETKDFMLKKFSSELGDKISVIPLGVDIIQFRFREELRDEFREELNISSKTKLILYTGKRDLFKNPFILVKILRKLILSNLDYKVLMVGENVNSYDDRITRYLERYPALKTRVHLLGPVMNSSLPKVYSSADVAIWPNGSSMSMLEAMACCCPVIASDI